MKPQRLRAVSRLGLLLGALMVCATASHAAEPRLAYAQWLLDSGDAYGAAMALAAMPEDSTGNAAHGERKRLLWERALAAVDRQLNAASSAEADGERPKGAAYTALRTAARHLAMGGHAQAIAALQTLLERDDESAAPLQDAARLLLARIALQSGNAEAARAHYLAVRSPGPYSSQALLELGWSYLLPLGGAAGVAGQGLWARAALPLRASSADALAALRRETPFRTHDGVARNERSADLAAAVRIWQELIGRDPLDPAVHEGQLALAYAFQHMGANEQALRRYRRVVEQLSRGRVLLSTALEHVQQGQLVAAIAEHGAAPAVGWPWWVIERRANRWWIGVYQPPTALFYAPYLMADSTFVAAVERLRLACRAQARLQRALDGENVAATARLEGEARSLKGELMPALQAAEQTVERRAVALLQARRADLERALAEAHFALARMREMGIDSDQSEVSLLEGAR